MSDKAPILEMRNISKRFDTTQALDDVSLTLYPGEIHALLGENGAGKSTLIKIMTGVHPPDRGYLTYYLTYLIAGGQLTPAEGAQFNAGRMGDYTITKDPTRDNGLRVLMGSFSIYDKSNVEAAAK